VRRGKVEEGEFKRKRILTQRALRGKRQGERNSL